MTIDTKYYKSESEKDLNDYHLADKAEKEEKRLDYLDKWQNLLLQAKTFSQIKVCNTMIKIFS